MVSSARAISKSLASGLVALAGPSVTHVRRWQQIDSLSTLFKFVEKFAWMDAFLLPPSRRRAANMKTTLNRNGKNSNNVNEGWLTDDWSALFAYISLCCAVVCDVVNSRVQHNGCGNQADMSWSLAVYRRRSEENWNSRNYLASLQFSFSLLSFRDCWLS